MAQAEDKLETKIFQNTMGRHLDCCSYFSVYTYYHTNGMFCYSVCKRKLKPLSISPLHRSYYVRVYGLKADLYCMYDIFGSLNKLVYFLNFIKNMGHIDHFIHVNIVFYIYMQYLSCIKYGLSVLINKIIIQKI